MKMINYVTDADRIKICFDFVLRIIVMILSIFYDMRIILHAVWILILFDQVMGVTFALIKKQFNWHVFNKVYRKIITYMLVIMATFVYERYLLGGNEMYFTKIVGALVGFQEIASVYLTFAKLTGIELFKQIFDKMRG